MEKAQQFSNPLANSLLCRMSKILCLCLNDLGALEWFKSYLKGRYQYVRVGDVVS